MNNLVTRFEEIRDTDRRGSVSSYHSKPSPIFRTKAKQSEIKGLQSTDRTNVVVDGDEFESKFTIGFEIEKTRLHRSSIKEYPLFCGFETDSSCGYEAVTHVLPLVGKSMWRTKVFNMFVEAKHIINDEFSPSDSSCGGHITVACKGLTGQELADKVAPYASILLSVFRHRLSNHYCKWNPRMMSEFRFERHQERVVKYSVCKIVDECIEFRIPSRVQSVKQLMRRYELMYLILDYGVNGKSIRGFWNAVRPILMGMYDKNETKTDAVIELAKDFHKFVKTGRVCQNTIGWFEKWWSGRPNRRSMSGNRSEIARVWGAYIKRGVDESDTALAKFREEIQSKGLR